MINLKQYEKLKNEELMCLNECLNSLSISKTDDTSKHSMITHLRALNILKNNNIGRITNINEIKESQITQNIAVTYSYKRYDMQITYRNPFFYDFSDNFNCKYFFTTSGMSAIFNTILALNNNYRHIHYSQDIYFETIKILKSKLSKMKDSSINRSEVLYLDTISEIFDLNEILIKKCKKLKLLLIDTTLAPRFSVNNIEPIVCKLGIPIVLLRSHTKLDMLGTEYSSLGSIYILIPQKIRDINKFKNFYNELSHYLSLSGVRSDYFSIPIFWETTNYYEINYLRLMRIKDNTRYIYNQLIKEEKLKVVMPQHQIFLLILVFNQTRSSLNNIIDEFVKSSSSAHKAGSFGFDFIALDCYWSEDRKCETIRISPSDQNIEVIDIFINEFTRWYNEIY